MIETKRALVAGLISLVLLAGAAPAAELKVPLERYRQLDPKVDIKHRIQLRPELVRVLQAARIERASLSVYAVPFDNWCAGGSNRTTEGRVTLQVRFTREADGTTVPAYLAVDTGAGVVRKRVPLGAGTFSVTSDVLRFPASEICTDRCVTAWLEPVNPGDAGRIDTTRTRACIP